MAEELEVNVQPVFSTPLVSFMVPGHEVISEQLRRVILERESSMPPHPDHEVIGWSSPHDLSMLDWAGPPLKTLFAVVVEVATQLTEYAEQEPSLMGHHPGWQVVEVWANVQRQWGRNDWHPHPGAFWSGCYYVDVGDIATGATCGGELQLLDPRGCMPKMVHPYLRYSMPALHDAGRTISLVPVSGQCVMFPGWLYHAVNSYHGSAPRISVAFNLEPILSSELLMTGG